MTFSESIVEEAALAWTEALGFSVRSGIEIAPGELAAERSNYDTVILPNRLQAALHKLNPALSSEVLEEALRQITLVASSSLIANNRALHRVLVDGLAIESR